MTKSKIMQAAWAMYKANNCTMRAEFAVALKAAWVIAKAPIQSAEDKQNQFVLAHGGKEWINPKNQEVRYYFNVKKLVEAPGLPKKDASTKVYVSGGKLYIGDNKMDAGHIWRIIRKALAAGFSVADEELMECYCQYAI